MLNPFFHYLRLRNNIKLDPADLRKITFNRLRYILKFSYENIPFYRDKFDKGGVKPGDINGIEDLSKIPITERTEIQLASKEDIVFDYNNLNKYIRRKTSGSTGKPLSVYVPKRNNDLVMGVWFRSHRENGLKFTDTITRIRNPRSFIKKEFYHNFGILRTSNISTFDPPQKQIALLEHYQPDLIRSQPSSLEILASQFEDELGGVSPRVVITSAELLDDTARKQISSAFRADLLDYYSSEELGLIAWECRDHVGYHVNSDVLHVETVDGDVPSLPGEEGEIVVTDLTNDVMPLIRYRLGDIGRLEPDSCSCGVTLPLMKVISGRRDDFLLTLDGTMIAPNARHLFDDAFRGIELKQYKVIQESREKLHVQFVLRSHVDDLALNRASEFIKEFFGDEMTISFEFVDNIERDPSGKLRKFVSHINARDPN